MPAFVISARSPRIEFYATFIVGKRVVWYGHVAPYMRGPHHHQDNNAGYMTILLLLVTTTENRGRNKQENVSTRAIPPLLKDCPSLYSLPFS